MPWDAHDRPAGLRRMDIPAVAYGRHLLMVVNTYGCSGGYMARRAYGLDVLMAGVEYGC